jgi:membrane associated rhomboid family serine protease/Tfp pilus assembly protein PilF
MPASGTTKPSPDPRQPMTRAPHARENKLVIAQAHSKRAASYLSVTVALIGLNLALFLLMSLTGAHLLQLTSEQTVRWGGNYGPLTIGGQWWRLITAMFVHLGLLHLLVNMWCLYHLGTLAEQIYGGPSVLFLYLLTGVAGGIASLIKSPSILSAGASGAVFGVAGALIVTLCLGKLPVPPKELKVLLASLIAFAGYNLTFGFIRGGMDNGAHVGGLVCGLVIGAFLSPNPVTSALRRERVRVFSLTLLALVGGFGVLTWSKGLVVSIESARQALEQHNPDLAIRRLEIALRTKPNESAIMSLLGTAYAEKRQYTEAENYFQRSLQLNPGDISARNGLGLAFLNTGRLPEALKQFEKVVELNPKAEDAWLTLALLLQRLGKHEEAVGCLKKAVALDPRSAAARFDLGISEMNLRHYDEAIVAFKKAAELTPTDYGTLTWLANAYEAAGLKKEADLAYFRASQSQHAPRRK